MFWVAFCTITPIKPRESGFRCGFSTIHVISPEWETLQGDDLRAFLSGKRPLVRAREQWHPLQDDPVAHIAEAMCLPLHIADQLYAHMLESMGKSEPLDEDSPWRTLNNTD